MALLNISNKNAGGVTVVNVSGRIVYGEEANHLRREVRELFTSGSNKIVLNLAGVPYIDSGGIGALVGLYTSAHTMGAKLKLACANDKVTHVLEITRLIPILGMFPNEELAVAAIKNSGTACA